MNTPTAYGSENEETSAFIRRIAAPDRANAKRKQKTRRAVVSATVGILAASAVCGYAAMKNGEASESNVVSQTLEAATAQYVTPIDDSYYPSMEQLDTNKDNIVSQTEYLMYLHTKMESDISQVKAAALPEDIKENLISQITENFESDAKCFLKAMKRLKASKITLTAKKLSLLFNTLDEFCPTNPVVIPEDLLHPPTEAPAVAPTDAPVYQPATTVPVYEPATEAPHYTKAPMYEPATEAPHYTEAPMYEPATEAPHYTVAPHVPAWEEPATEAPYAPTWEEPATEAPHVPAWEEPATEAPHVPAWEEPATEAPIYDQVTETPMFTESPMMSSVEPTYVEPTPEEPTPTEPTPEEPIPTEPTPEEPTSEGSTLMHPTAEEPITQEPTPSQGGETNDVIDKLGGFDNQTPADETSSPENIWMTKEEFRQKITDYFAAEAHALEQEAESEAHQAQLLADKIKALDQCIFQASEKVRISTQILDTAD
jgi:hypothetical protein